MADGKVKGAKTDGIHANERACEHLRSPHHRPATHGSICVFCVICG